MTDSIHTFSAHQLVRAFSRQDSYWDNPVFGDFDRFGFHRIADTRHLMVRPLPPHRKTFHDFFLVTKGLLRRAKGIQEYEVTRNTFCFVPANTITFNALGSDDVEGYMCHFDERVMPFDHHPFLRHIEFLQLDGFPLVTIPDERFAHVQHLLHRIEEEFHSRLPDRFLLIQAYLITLFLELGRFALHKSPAPVPACMSIADKFKKLLHAHIDTQKDIAAYAGMLCITPNHLNKCVKQATHKTAGEWIDDMLILESKVLLSQTSLSIAEIAFRAGMEDQSYFGRFFKKKTGLTPSEYRKMIEKF